MVEKVREYMYKNDKLFELLGARILEMKEGYAKVEMVVKDEHLNAAKVCHGGIIFSIADLAFALASNSHGKIALAIEVSITYMKAAFEGEKLAAEAKEVNLGNRTATYLMEVRNSKNELVALAKGTVYRMDKEFPPTS
ncbi:MAG: hydroxyphenylacetyl-CoA thioesterase PaaI [Archaeoglobus sp.]|uniref:hydroxyphenylacetyl-CoA thioesterase PaaI n=1 Tax=Archaeoglobus sp. TaxID=1872626 RepID=UPI001D242A49|nr:hydroxyphenylacetyl-CoA thioesterase PaaI [Archaeoglobus sp.]MBO8180216.1 hydroxyphenylacetyl-CoA thioesterase PaaI [Archaeoglobus sp.]